MVSVVAFIIVFRERISVGIMGICMTYSYYITGKLIIIIDYSTSL